MSICDGTVYIIDPYSLAVNGLRRKIILSYFFDMLDNLLFKVDCGQKGKEDQISVNRYRQTLVIIE
jgi:hypothetical protein